MKFENSRKLEYADRFAVQQADQAIRKDIVRALVELITNSNDSYNRLEGNGISTTSEIFIEIQRKNQNSVLKVRDFAEGMTVDDLNRKAGRYGEATSGFTEGKSVRGLWGRGLKDSFFGLGHGYINTIRDNSFSKCGLGVDENGKPTGSPIFLEPVSIQVNKALREMFFIPSGNGTEMEIIISRDDVRIPQIDNLRRQLERHFELRGIMGSENRSVYLREINSRGKTESEIKLTHKPPVGEKVLDESVTIPGYDAFVDLQIFRASEPLTTPSEEGDYADGGIIVGSKGVALSLTLFKFNDNEHASRFYGVANCDRIHDLLRTDDSILTATRDGINWKHQFAKAFKEIVENKLGPLVDAERKKAQSEQRNSMSKKLRERLNSALEELNSIAKTELGKLDELGGGGGSGGKKPPSVPAGGFGFIPEYALIQTGKVASLTLRASIPEKLQDGCNISIVSSSSEVLVLTPQVQIKAREDYTGLGEVKVELEGRQVGAIAIITASVGGLTAEASVQVISKKEPPGIPPEKKEHGGLFRDVKFDPAMEPRQRVRFDRSNANIVIATKAPSVAAYLDENGVGSEEPQGQVLLA